MPLPKDLVRVRTGWHHSDETKRKIGAKSKGRVPSDETRKKISDAGKGREVSVETRLKISNSRNGIKFSDETKRRISLSNMGRQGYWTGKKRAIETIEKMRIARIGKKLTDGHKEKIRFKMIGCRNGVDNPMYIDGRSKLKNKYCPKFNNYLKSRVREFFGNRCILCNKTPQESKNFKEMECHHVFSEKKACCESEIEQMDNLRKTFPESVARVGSPEFSELELKYIRMIVPLCKSCHGKMNAIREHGVFEDTYYKKKIVEIVMNHYNGKCYFTNEEMMGITAPSQ